MARQKAWPSGIRTAFDSAPREAVCCHRDRLGQRGADFGRPLRLRPAGHSRDIRCAPISLPADGEGKHRTSCNGDAGGATGWWIPRNLASPGQNRLAVPGDPCRRMGPRPARNARQGRRSYSRPSIVELNIARLSAAVVTGPSTDPSPSGSGGRCDRASSGDSRPQGFPACEESI